MCYTVLVSKNNIMFALLAQLDRVFGYEPKGRGFESLIARHNVGAKFALLRFSLTRKTSACFLAPHLSQKGSFASAIRLQARSFRLWLTYHLFARFSPFNAHFCFSIVGAKFALLRFSLSRKTSACFLAPHLSQKGSFTSAIRLQARSFRLWLTYHLFARFSPFNAHFCFSPF